MSFSFNETKRSGAGLGIGTHYHASATCEACRAEGKRIEREQIVDAMLAWAAESRRAEGEHNPDRLNTLRVAARAIERGEHLRDEGDA